MAGVDAVSETCRTASGLLQSIGHEGKITLEGGHYGAVVSRRVREPLSLT